jgi:hypothetical protein
MNITKNLILSIIFIFSILIVFGDAREDDRSFGHSMNKAVHVEIIKKTFTSELAGIEAPEGNVFLLIETQWENIHPKQKVEKDKLEGKTDRTMGVGALGGRKKKKKTEYVDRDVAYQIDKLYDHAYLLVDGLAYSLHEVTEEAPGGVPIRKAFSLPKKGDLRKVDLVYLIPEGDQNLCFQFFDYDYGHILLSVRGNLEAARGTGEPPKDVIGHFKSDLIEIAAYSVNLHDKYGDNTAPDGWNFAVLQISGKSLSGSSVKDILEIEPDEYCWVIADGGYFYYCKDASTSVEGYIRFTPEIHQHQELAFLVPKNEQLSKLGIRIRNDVFQIALSKEKQHKIPDAKASHKDGDVMEVELFGWRKDGAWIILDLGIKSLVKSGIEIQRDQQFMLDVEGERIECDEDKTDSLYHGPPNPFIIPPKTIIRFELAFKTDSIPEALYFRGYESEDILKLPDSDDQPMLHR